MCLQMHSTKAGHAGHRVRAGEAAVQFKSDQNKKSTARSVWSLAGVSSTDGKGGNKQVREKKKNINKMKGFADTNLVSRPHACNC